MKRFLIGASVVMMLSACSNSHDSGITDEPQSPEVAGSVKIHLVSGDMTRAFEDEAIESLYLAYYNDDILIDVVEAVKTDGSEDFTSEVPGNKDNLPNRILAYANLPETYLSMINKDFPAINGVSIPECVVSNDGSTLYVMTSSLHYEELDDEDILVCYTPISKADYVGGDKTININVERLAAKVSASLSGSISSDALIVKDVYGSSLIDKSFTLSINNWDVSATENETFLLKQYDESVFTPSIPMWLKDDKGIIHWAKSLSYSSELTIPESNNDGTESYTLQYLPYNAISNAFGGYAYYHESTRPASDYDKDNAVASIVLMGQYLNADKKAEDVIKYIDTYYTKVGFGEVFNDEQMVIYANGGQSFSAETLTKYLEFEPTGNGGEAKIIVKNEIIGKAYDSNGDKYQSVEEINEALQKQFPTVEYFKEGRCFFVFPIRHKGYVESESKHGLGSYGLVRNHHYNISVEGISGIGSAIASEDALSIKSDFKTSDKTYSVNYGVNVMGWSEVTQTISR